MDELRKDDPNPENTPQRNRPKHFETYTVPTDNVENTKSTN